jgi:SAM-dependent methyltransferase
LEKPRLSHKLNKEEILRILSGRPKWHQKVQLPFGLETNGEDCSQIANQIFPLDLKGASVLNIGCEEGFFCFEAKRRNAGRIVGVGPDDGYLSAAMELNELLGTDIDFLRCDISDIEELGLFDYVLCLNSLHLAEDPRDFIHKLIRIAGRKLIIEIADLRLKMSNARHRLWRLLLTLLPYSFQPSVLILGSDGRYLMTRKWIEALFQNRYSDIERVEFLDSDSLNRHLVVATMRRLDSLQVISGPSGVGKSVFIDRLGSGDPEVVKILGFTLEDGWQLVMAKELKTSAGKEINKLLLHYDIAKPIERSYRIHDDDPALIITRAAAKMVYVLVCPPDVLIERVQRRVQNSRNQNHLKRKEWLISEYSQPGRLHELYANWISYCKANLCEIKYIDVSSTKVRTVIEEDALKLVRFILCCITTIINSILYF